MYEIKENRRELFDGTEITTYTRDVVSANILQVEAGTTGYKGGDTGHSPWRRLRTGNHDPRTEIYHKGAGGRIGGGV